MGDGAEVDLDLTEQREFLVLTGFQSDTVRGSMLHQFTFDVGKTRIKSSIDPR